jgi:hypothetical protein
MKYAFFNLRFRLKLGGYLLIQLLDFAAEVESLFDIFIWSAVRLLFL